MSGNEKFGKLMRSASQQIDDGKYEVALKTLASAQALLESDGDSSLDDWSWIYDYRRYALYELGRIDEALDECRKAIAHLGPEPHAAYLKELCQVRATLRAAHNSLAWVLCERATTVDECEPALEHIKQCLNTVSPIDGTNPLDPFQETHAVVLLKMSQLQNKDKSYQLQLHRLLAKLKRTKHEALENKELAAVLKTEEFQKFLDDNEPEDTAQLAETETTSDALKRFQKALANSDPDRASFYKVEHSPIPAALLSEHETNLGIHLPPSLRQFAIERGELLIDSGEPAFEFLTHWGRDKTPDFYGLGLADLIDDVGGGSDLEDYDDAEREHLNKNYVVFAIRYADISGCFDLLYFDKAGKFGSLLLDQHDRTDFFEDLSNMFEESSPATKSFDQLMSEQITKLIEDLMDD
jgi:tetratricopeptide (TPR) repeat protein